MQKEATSRNAIPLASVISTMCAVLARALLLSLSLSLSLSLYFSIVRHRIFPLFPRPAGSLAGRFGVSFCLKRRRMAWQ